MRHANRGGRSEEWPQFKTDSLVALDEWPAQRALIGETGGLLFCAEACVDERIRAHRRFETAPFLRCRAG